MDMNDSSLDEKKSESFLRDLKQIATTLSSSSDVDSKLSDSKMSLKDEIENEIKNFYSKSINKLMKSVSFSISSYSDNELLNEHEKFELSSEKAFKAINNFSRTIAAKLDKKSSTAENKNSRKRLETYDSQKENKRLGKLLESKHLKNEKMRQSRLYNTDESDYGEDSEDEAMHMSMKAQQLERFSVKNSSTDNLSTTTTNSKFYEKYAKKNSSQIEKSRLKTKIVRSMYNRALFNQEKSKKMHLIFLSNKSKHLKAHSCFKENSQLLNEESVNKLLNNKPSYNYMNRSNSSESSSEQTFLTQSNLPNRKHQNQLKISCNPYNSNIEVFVIPQTAVKPKRPHLDSNLEFKIGETVSVVLEENKMVRASPKNSPKIRDSLKIPVNLDMLAKESRVLTSKTHIPPRTWRNYCQ